MWIMITAQLGSTDVSWNVQECLLGDIIPVAG